MVLVVLFFFSSRRRHTRCALLTGVQTCALPICARETAVRVAAGAIAKKYLREKFGTEIRGCVEQIGAIHCGGRDWASVNQNPFFCADPARLPELEALIDALRSEGDSIGAKLYVEEIGRAHVCTPVTNAHL